VLYICHPEEDERHFDADKVWARPSRMNEEAKAELVKAVSSVLVTSQVGVKAPVPSFSEID
jgi:hypothetical protein